MRRRLELDIATCEECPYQRYNVYYSMSEDSGYDCEHLNAPHTRIINDSQIKKEIKESGKKWNYEIPDWCPLPNRIPMLGLKMEINKLLTSEAFDKAYEEYHDECNGISFSVCDTYYGPGELEEKYKNAARWLVKKILDDFLMTKVKPVRDNLVEAGMLLDHPDMGGTNQSKARQKMKEAEKILR